MITIDQLLESVDLDFEPRFVTKGNKGFIEIHKATPKRYDGYWSCQNDCLDCADFGRLKIAEFEGKDWTECIYEVPRKTTGKIERFTQEDFACVFDTENYHRNVLDSRAFNKLNALVDAVNELKAKFALPTLNPDLTDEDLRKMMCDPKYWRDRDSATIQKVQNGFNKLYGDKN